MVRETATLSFLATTRRTTLTIIARVRPIRGKYRKGAGRVFSKNKEIHFWDFVVAFFLFFLDKGEGRKKKNDIQTRAV